MKRDHGGSFGIEGLNELGCILSTIIGGFCGVFLGFLVSKWDKEEVDRGRKLFLLSLLRSQVRKQIELLGEVKGNILPTDVWNSIVNSGDIKLSTHGPRIPPFF